jgi:hypothetical protein
MVNSSLVLEKFYDEECLVKRGKKCPNFKNILMFFKFSENAKLKLGK